ncbi:tetratricopeptide repeat protein [Paracoccus salsus]|uniref:tetratricopeptide repeat protein n=1 Tax=Paracoccus salsus TaxID=2911061 RepID=UPI001F42DC89|nr:tetratricopeptide repeat protein [Paracoccus salsus]MCF3972211.1 tetratricopeptide repeat protein [Paracoccus salsus]
MTNTAAAIVGMCDRGIAAQLIGLLNVIRLGRKFGAHAVLFHTAGQTAGAADLHMLLEPGFVSRWTAALTKQVELSGRPDLVMLLPDLSEAHLAGRIASGERFVIDRPPGILSLMDEGEDQVRREVAGIAAELPFIPEIGAALSEAVGCIEAWGGEDMSQAVALHLCRGGGSPGPSPDHVADEFARSWAARQTAAVLLFADCPQAEAHVARADPGLIAAGGLWAGDLGPEPARRKVLDILLMSRCARIGGASASLTARAAAALGGRRFCPLPEFLSPGERHQAASALIDRIVNDPASFLDLPDLVRSAEQAAIAAQTAGQGMRLARALCEQGVWTRARPFLRHVIAASALAGGDEALARVEAGRGLAESVLNHHATMQCRQVLDLIAGQDDPRDPASQDGFLVALLTDPAVESPTRDRLADLHLGRDGAMARTLMFPVGVLAARSHPAVSDGRPALAVWACRLDWQELLPDEAACRPMRDRPPLHAKLAMLGPELAEVEQALVSGHALASPQPGETLDRLGLAAAALSLHGRHARALRLLKWLVRQRPDDPLTRKRLADVMFRLDRAEEGHAQLQAALRSRPDNPLLHLSLACRAADQGDARRAWDAHRHAGLIWSGSRIVSLLADQLRNRLAARR